MLDALVLVEDRLVDLARRGRVLVWY